MEGCLRGIGAGFPSASAPAFLRGVGDGSNPIRPAGGVTFPGVRLPELSWGAHLSSGALPGEPRVRRTGRAGGGVGRRGRVSASTAEKVVEKDHMERFYEAVSTCSDPAGVFKVLDRDLSSTSGRRGEDEDGKFDWLAQWYPVGVLRHMDKTQPHAVTVLGRDLVMWWDRIGGEWKVFADVCPHRQAPLSEGRIDEQGHLQCSYHGWAFASSGACTLIPQAPPDKLHVRDSRRACAKAYQSREHQGLLFVYMDTSEGAPERAAANPPPFVPQLDDPDFIYDMGMSDVPYSYDTLIENLVDAAHVFFAHHNILANRKAGGPIENRIEKFGKAGFLGSRGGFMYTLAFSAPCLATSMSRFAPRGLPETATWAQKLRQFVKQKVAGAGSSNMMYSTVFFALPMVPGKTRIFFATPRNFGKTKYLRIPTWVKHLGQMTLLDSDSYLLHRTERQIEAGGGVTNTTNLYYTPTASDVHVNGFRRWMTKFGGGVPDYGPKASPRLPPSDPKTVLLDRKASHVDNCTFCSGALHNLQALESLLHVMPVVLVGLAAASNSKLLRGLSGFTVPLVCLGLGSFVASQWLSKWIKKNFEFHDYNHALVK